MTIVINYWEGDDVQHAPLVSERRPFTKLAYAEWTRDGREEWAHADENKFKGGDETEGDGPLEDGEVRGIPDDVRETLALLIAPSLAAKVQP